MFRVNLGGEGEVPDVLNQQGRWVGAPGWPSKQAGGTLRGFLLLGHDLLICDNDHIALPDESVDEVITNSVPVDVVNWRGPGIQSSEVIRLLLSGRVDSQRTGTVYETMTSFLKLWREWRFDSDRLEVIDSRSERFPSVVRDHQNLRLWKPGMPFGTEGIRLLIGVVTWSGYDMLLLDMTVERMDQTRLPGMQVDVFDMDECDSEDRIREYVPGIRKVAQPPVVGLWQLGHLRRSESGHSARELVEDTLEIDSRMFDARAAELHRRIDLVESH